MTRPLTVFHGADFHLDTPFTAADFGTPAQRRAQLRKAALAALTQAKDCDLVLLAGDLFDQPETVYPETMELLCAAFEDLNRPVFLSPGNHDPFTASSLWSRSPSPWPGNVHVFRPGEIQAVELPDLGCTVYGTAFGGTEAFGLLRGFHGANPDTCNLMVLHGDPANPASPYNYISQEQIAASGLHYLALGHLHTASGLKQAGQTFYAWPGCLLGRDFGETGQKGCYHVRVEPGYCTLSLLPTQGPRWILDQASVQGDAQATVSAICAALQPGDHLRLTLRGLCPGFDASALAQDCRGQLGSLELIDETLDTTALWQDAGQDTLRGAFLSQLLSKRAEDRPLAELAAAYGLAALEGREAP